MATSKSQDSEKRNGKSAQSRPKMEQKERKIRSGTPPGLPKSVRDASGAPPNDENAGQRKKPPKNTKNAQKSVKSATCPYSFCPKKNPERR